MNYLNELERYSIVLFSIIFIIQGLFINFKLYGLGLLGYFLNENLNKIFKNYVAKPLIGNKNIPILGIGKRPKGAKNCGVLSDGKIAKTYGMPSGHSQDAGFFMIYQILNTKNTFLKVLTAFVSIWVMLSRVKLGCHTYQQVIIGGLIGVIFGYIYNYIYHSYVKNNI